MDANNSDDSQSLSLYNLHEENIPKRQQKKMLSGFTVQFTAGKLT